MISGGLHRTAPAQVPHILNDPTVTPADAGRTQSELNILHPCDPPGCLEGILQKVTQVVKLKFLPPFSFA